MTRALNQRQRDVLQWIGNGCPDRAWPDESHKHSARALEARGLVKVSRVDGRWTARLTDAGSHFLEHGDYPPELKKQPLAPRRTAGRTPNSTTVTSAQPTAPSREPSVPLGPPDPTDAQRLYVRVLASGGRLEVADREDGKAASELEKSGLAPAGKLIKSKRRGWHHRVLYVVDDPRAVVPRRELAVRQRLTRPHPVARAYQQDKDHQEVSPAHLARAVRIVHALATAFDELGFTMDLRTGRTPDGQFHVRSDGPWGTSIRLSEKSAPGGPALPHYATSRYRSLPAWQARRQKQFISTGKLTILVGGAYSQGTRQFRFSDTKTHALEDVLSDVVREIEMRFLERRQDDEEARREETEQEQRWQRVLDDAEVRAAEEHRARVLSARASTWNTWQDEKRYIDQLEAHLPDLTEEERLEAKHWIEWSRGHLDATNPMLTRHGMPEPPHPTREHIEPHLRGWVGQLRAFRT